MTIPGQDSTDVTFRRSSFCGGGACVEVAVLPDGDIAMRDSKDVRDDAPVLRFTAEEWTSFIAGVLDGQFDRSALRQPSP